MSTPADPFRDIMNLIADMPHADEDMAASLCALMAAEEGEAAFGRLGEIGIWLAGWTSKLPLVVEKPLIAVFAASDGVAARITRAAPQALNRHEMDRLAGGTATVSRICATHEIGLRVLDLAVDLPTPDITLKPAFTAKECTGTFAFGMEAVAGGGDLLGLSGLGAGGEIAALAVLYALGLPVAGADEAARLALEAVTGQGVAGGAALDVLAKVGGREIAAIAGAIIAARYQRVPVVLDGLQALAAARVLQVLEPSAIAHCLVARVPHGPHGAAAVAHLGYAPLLDLGLGLNDASGAALAITLIQSAACAIGGDAGRPVH